MHFPQLSNLEIHHAAPVVATSIAMTLPLGFINDMAVRIISTVLTAVISSLVVLAMNKAARRWSLPPEVPKDPQLPTPLNTPGLVMLRPGERITDRPPAETAAKKETP